MTQASPPSKQAQLQTVLSNLRSALPELRGALITTVDGLPMAHSFTDGLAVERVAAMAATAVGLGKRIADTLGAGTFSETSVSGPDGQVFLYASGARSVLAVVAPAGVNLGLLHMEARESAQAVSAIL